MPHPDIYIYIYIYIYMGLNALKRAVGYIMEYVYEHNNKDNWEP